MENKNAAEIENSKQAAFLTSVTNSCGSAADFVDDGDHPSLPNYIKATSGDTQGIADDGAPARHQLDVDNIFRQVRASGGTAKSYEESMSDNCALVSTATYAVKHNPAAYYAGGDDRAACQRDDVPFDSFATDLVGGLPSFSFITPNICNDMHSCPIGTGDQWLSAVVTSITTSDIYRQGATAVFIVFDESEGSGTMPLFVIAPSVLPGTRAVDRFDHYSLLAFTEDALGITSRLGRAAQAIDLAPAFNL
ncbi:MAG: phosphoesterase [Acidimicrobiales bacterium]|nr:phosphoesterase [Acidimicrobiales bacterium]